MATSQLTLFDLETPPGMICRKPTKKYPNGRTGTNTGYAAHRHAGEAPCHECVEGKKKYKSEMSRKRTESKPADAPACATPSRRRPEGQSGTYAGYKLHLEADEDPCLHCIDARDARKRNMEAKKRKEISQYDLACQAPSRENPSGTTGTFAGYRAHEYYNETPCNECEKAATEYCAQYKSEYYLKNKDKLLSYSRDYQVKNREELNEKARIYYRKNRDVLLSKGKIYYRENKDWISIQKDEYRIENRDKFAFWNRVYRRRHPEKGKVHTSRRRARKLALPLDGYTFEDLILTHGKVCYLCETEVDTTLPTGLTTSPHVDHVHPISREGCPGDVLDNCRVVHARCNLVKGAKLVSELTLPFISPLGPSTSLPDYPV